MTSTIRNEIKAKHKTGIIHPIAAKIGPNMNVFAIIAAALSDINNLKISFSAPYIIKYKASPNAIARGIPKLATIFNRLSINYYSPIILTNTTFGAQNLSYILAFLYNAICFEKRSNKL